MKELAEARKEDRRQDPSMRNGENPARSATRKTKPKAKKAEAAHKPRRKPARRKRAARIKEEAGVYGADLRDFVTLEAAPAAAGKNHLQHSRLHSARAHCEIYIRQGKELSNEEATVA